MARAAGRGRRALTFGVEDAAGDFELFEAALVELLEGAGQVGEDGGGLLRGAAVGAQAGGAEHAAVEALGGVVGGGPRVLGQRHRLAPVHPRPQTRVPQHRVGVGHLGEARLQERQEKKRQM